jgi:hypothetical protein
MRTLAEAVGDVVSWNLGSRGIIVGNLVVEDVNLSGKFIEDGKWESVPVKHYFIVPKKGPSYCLGIDDSPFYRGCRVDDNNELVCQGFGIFK